MIIFPALLLAAMGLYALRQDRVLARVDAEEQANRLAIELAETALPKLAGVVATTLGELHPADEAWKLPGAPAQEALMRLRIAWSRDRTGMGESVCLVDAADELLHPPRPRPLPVPQPLALETLNLAQQNAWFACEEMWGLGGAPNWERVQILASLGVPERLRLVARLRTALAQIRAELSEAEYPAAGSLDGHGGERALPLGIPQMPHAWAKVNATLARALEELHKLRDVDPAHVAESGIPIRDLAVVQRALLVGALPAAERAAAVQDACARLVVEPSPVAEAMWEQLDALGTMVEPWQVVRELHREGRDLHEALRKAGTMAGIVQIRGEERSITELPVKGGRWLVAIPTAAWLRAFDEIQQSTLKPAHFGVGIQLAGRATNSPRADQPVLARRSSVMGGMPVDLVVFLSDPAGFDARRAQRARWTVGLIGVSLLAVFAGFFAAWRAFRRQQQLSEMKTNFVSSVSHELRTPIASVQLMAQELVEGERPSDEKLATYHRFIGQECRRLSGVIENVLDFARREQGRERFEFQPTDLRSLVRDTVRLLQPYAADRGGRITEVCQGRARDVVADGHALQRVLVNLVDNAIKHSPPHSEVVVGLEFDAERVTLWVEDEGPGIPRAEQERIFERFYRIGSELRRQTQGIGLGLSIVKHLVEVHRGTIRVHSAPGEGSRFVVELPAGALVQAEPSNVSST